MVLLFTLYQFQSAPLALPLTFMILNELVIWIKYSNRQLAANIDHILNILFYIYVTFMYYLDLQYYILSNIFIMLSFIFQIACDKKLDGWYEYSTIIRLSKIFYRFSLMIAILCITLKINSYVDWTWSQTFWWYWMFFSGLIGSMLTLLLILISKLIQIKNSTIIDQQKNEIKLLIWLLYIATSSSLIAGTWIVNTLNVLGINVNIKIGDFYMYIIISLNILIFCSISYLLFNPVVEFVLYLFIIIQARFQRYQQNCLQQLIKLNQEIQFKNKILKIKKDKLKRSYNQQIIILICIFIQVQLRHQFSCNNYQIVTFDKQKIQKLWCSKIQLNMKYQQKEI